MRPQFPEDECCTHPKWINDDNCKVIQPVDECEMNPYSLECCMSNKSDISSNTHPCCTHEQIKAEVDACGDNAPVIYVNFASISPMYCNGSMIPEYCVGMPSGMNIYAAARKYCKDRGMTMVDHRSHTIYNHNDDFNKTIPASSGVVITDNFSIDRDGNMYTVTYVFNSTNLSYSNGHYIGNLDGSDLQNGQNWFVCYKF